MPSGRAAAPRRFPLHLALLARRRRPPDREVRRIPLALDDFDARPGLLASQIQPGQLAVAAVLGRVEVEPGRQPVAPARAVEDLGEPDHLRDVVGGLAPDVGVDDPQPRDVGLEVPGVPRGDVPRAAVLPAGGELELVVANVSVRGQVPDIGDVDDVPDPQALPGQRALERVGEDVGPHVPDVLVGVDRRPARVDPDVGRPGRREVGDLAGQRVEQPQRKPGGARSHGASRYRRPRPAARRLRRLVTVYGNLGDRQRGNVSAFAVAKAGIARLTESLACELAGTGADRPGALGRRRPDRADGTLPGGSRRPPAAARRGPLTAGYGIPVAIKLALVIRTDLEMGRGKIAA